MPKEKLTLEYVLMEIEDLLPDTCLPWIILEQVKQHHKRNALLTGFYLHYKIYEGDIDRALYLGTEPKNIRKKFEEFAKVWVI